MTELTPDRVVPDASTCRLYTSGKCCRDTHFEVSAIPHEAKDALESAGVIGPNHGTICGKPQTIKNSTPEASEVSCLTCREVLFS